MSADPTTTVVFGGPSLPDEPDRRLTILPPVTHGDLARAVLDGATCVVVLDGLFERVRSVWHKEILWALAAGCRIIGASSMGALRGAECRPFGMEPVGRIAHDYVKGRRTSDGDVALAHLGSDDGWRSVSEALVDIDATLESLADTSRLAEERCRALAAAARDIFYADRTWHSVVHRAVEAGYLDQADRHRIADLVTSHRVDQKRLDAAEALAHLDTARPDAPDFEFAATSTWRRALSDIERRPL